MMTIDDDSNINTEILQALITAKTCPAFYIALWFQPTSTQCTRNANRSRINIIMARSRCLEILGYPMVKTT